MECKAESLRDLDGISFKSRCLPKRNHQTRQARVMGVDEDRNQLNAGNNSDSQLEIAQLKENQALALQGRQSQPTQLGILTTQQSKLQFRV
jgi:hypothetical protein